MAPRTDIRAAMKEYLQIVFHRKWYFLTPLVSVFLVVSISSFFMPKIYESSNLILVEQVRAKNPLVEGLAVATTVKGRLNTIREEIASRTRLLKVIKTLGLDKGIKNDAELFKLIAQLQKMLSVEVVGSNMIKISCEGPNPLALKRLVDTTTKFFIEKNLELESKEVETAIHFIQSQLDVYKKKLDDAESVLKNFQEINMLDLNASPGQALSQLLGLSGTVRQPVENAVAGQGINVNVSRLIDFQNQLLQIDVELNEAMERRAMLQAQLEEQDEVIVAEVVKESSPVVKMLHNQLSEMEMELSTLLVDATDEHPRVRELRSRIAMVRERIDTEKELITSSEMSTLNPLYQDLKKNLNEANLAIRSLNAKKQDLDNLTRQYQRKLKTLPEKELERANIMREYQIASNMYSMLLNRLETARVTKRLELLEQGTTFEVLDEAKIPSEPIKPRKGLIAVLGLILGFFFGSGLVFLVEYADSSFKGSVDAREYFKEPVLGIISQMITTDDVEQRRQTAKKRLAVGALVFVAVIILLFLFLKVL